MIKSEGLMSRAELEKLDTAELLRMKILITQIVADREANVDGEEITLHKPTPANIIPLVIQIREALGVGLREAKDMVFCGTTIRVASFDHAKRIKELLGKG